MTNPTADTLRKAKALISDPINWNRDGCYFKGADESSACMCIYGALGTSMVVDAGKAHLDDEILNSTCREMYGMSTTDFNDHPDTTHADIMALFDRAIELAEKETT